MKITIIHSIYKPHVRGGAEVVVQSIVDGLKKKGHDISVISVGRKTKMEKIDGIRVYRIKSFNLFNFLDINRKPVVLRLPWHLIDMFSYVQTLRVYKALKKERPDMVMTHNLKGLGYYIPWLVKIMKIKHIHTVHDMQLVHPSGLLTEGKRLGPLNSIYAWFCWQLFNGIEKVVFPSKYISSTYQKHGFFRKSEIINLGNPIKMSKVKMKEHNHPFCENPQLLFLGQIEEYKGIFDLIRAVEKMKGNYTLHVVGDGSDLDKAKKMANGNNKIIFYGWLDQSEIDKKIWPKIDLLVNPTHVTESFGMVTAEACAHGIPSVSSDIGAIPELIDDGQTGWLVPPGDTNTLSKKIDATAKNVCNYGSIGILCQDMVRKFETDKYLNKLIEFAKIT